MLIGLELISACAPTVAIPGGKCGQQSSPQCQYQMGASIEQAGMEQAGIGQGGKQVTVTTVVGDTKPEQRTTVFRCSMEQRAGQPADTVVPLLGKSPSGAETPRAQVGYTVKKAKANGVFEEIALSEGEAREFAANLPRQGARVNIPSLAQARGIISSHPEGRGIVPVHPEAAGIIPAHPQAPGIIPSHPQAAGIVPSHPGLRESFRSTCRRRGLSSPTRKPRESSRPTCRRRGLSSPTPRLWGSSRNIPRLRGLSSPTRKPRGLFSPTPRPRGLSSPTRKPRESSRPTPRPWESSRPTRRPGQSSRPLQGSRRSSRPARQAIGIISSAPRAPGNAISGERIQPRLAGNEKGIC